MAIQGQWAQLSQVAPTPAVGAAMSFLSGASWCIFQKMPSSVATINSRLGISSTALINWLVEPHLTRRPIPTSALDMSITNDT